MTGRKYRAQILLDVEQHDALVEIARREGRSLSDLVREMLWQQLEQRGRAVRPEVRRRLEALERIRRHRAEVLARRGGKPLEVDSAEMIRRMREERDERSLLAGSRH
ncbi:MAG TPA: ribbon-helix-helix protein, CopG family [Anaerolineales bacterium]|nr:ribbon-helix-helix protein, CopG family [Anaerolineae bacterium]HIQ00911.1 ribbon-helix-helix protein, CopG family [Anaerolineales bacterium]